MIAIIRAVFVSNINKHLQYMLIHLLLMLYCLSITHLIIKEISRQYFSISSTLCLCFNRLCQHISSSSIIRVVSFQFDDDCYIQQFIPLNSIIAQICFYIPNGYSTIIIVIVMAISSFILLVNVKNNCHLCCRYS
jgi:hypothetical protein